jgi:hypothetical protein
MFHLVFQEHTNFSYRDFLDIMKPKTYRNKILELKKEGIVEVDYISSVAFHTLSGYKFGKSGTRNHTGVTVSHNNPMYKILEGLVLGKISFHNVHITFVLPKIYNLFSYTDFSKFKRNQQIVVPSWKKYDATIRCVVSKTDTVSITVACSSQPIPLDFEGFNLFSSILGNIEGRLQNTVDMLSVKNHSEIDQIPNCDKWLITEWHLNRDALQEYTGKGFSITFETAKHMVYRVYSKDLGKLKHVRIEMQTSPKQNIGDIEDIIADKLSFP